MPQYFDLGANTVSRVLLYGGLPTVVLLAWLALVLGRSPYVTRAQVARVQPVPFSHKHHAGDNGIDCRYCHISVEESAFAGIPPTRTCMNCHSQIWAGSPVLAPVRESLASGRPLRWVRVHDLPGFVYFDHSIHVRKGVGCSTCHGRVDRMPLVRQVVSLQMEWCLDCHRAPERHLRPRAEIFNMAWQPPADQATQGRLLARAYGVRGPEALTSCSTCHR